MRWGGIFDYDKRSVRIIELTQQTQDPSFWNDPVEAQKVMKDLGYQKSLIQDWNTLNSLKESITVYLEFIEMGEPVEQELSV